MDRRQFLRAGSATALLGGLLHADALPKRAAANAADIRLRIEKINLDIGKGVTIKTTAYNGQVPGPMLRLKQGKATSIAVTNATAQTDIVHWHGLATDSLNDGAVEEGSPLIRPGEELTYHLTPRPAGTRWYHTHAMAMDDLTLGSYSGQFGFLLVEPPTNPARYNQEINLAIHHWGPSFVPMVDHLRAESHNMPQTTGSDVGYQYATINSHMLGEGEPIRVKQGQRVLMRLLNASATENVVLSLPGHRFHIVAMDGNPVPKPRSVEVLSLAVAERVDAIVEMNSPGRWILGSALAAEREKGLGIVVEYAGKTGEAAWHAAESSAEWDYSAFASTDKAVAPDETFPLIFRDAGALNGSKFDTWSINGKSWPNIEPLKVKRGKRYRLLFRNASGDQHPMHLHRHTFEVAMIGDKQMSGLMKDVVNVMPLQTVAVDFVADNPGDTLMHCHQQLHMDYGFMQLIRYID